MALFSFDLCGHPFSYKCQLQKCFSEEIVYLFHGYVRACFRDPHNWWGATAKYTIFWTFLSWRGFPGMLVKLLWFYERQLFSPFRSANQQRATYMHTQRYQRTNLYLILITSLIKVHINMAMKTNFHYVVYGIILILAMYLVYKGCRSLHYLWHDIKPEKAEPNLQK